MYIDAQNIVCVRLLSYEDFLPPPVLCFTEVRKCVVCFFKSSTETGCVSKTIISIVHFTYLLGSCRLMLFLWQ